MIQTAFNLCVCGCDSVTPVDIRERADHAYLVLRCPNCQLRRGVVAATAEVEWYLATVSDQVDRIIDGIDFVHSPRFDDAVAALTCSACDGGPDYGCPRCTR